MTGTKVLLSRWQFGITITYHFLFVPLTIGLAFLVAVMQVLASRTNDGLVCEVLVIVTRDIQARLMDSQQPMKMAAAEAGVPDT